jgi:biopolymer transport protein ExbD
VKPVGPTTSGARSLAGHAAHINVTPLIDIVMVLIVFYLIVGNLALDRRGDVELPAATAGDPAEPTVTPISVAISADGSVIIEAAPAPEERIHAMLDVLTRQRPGDPVRIRADRATPYRHVRTVLEICRLVGIDRVELATTAETPEARQGPRNGGAP